MSITFDLQSIFLDFQLLVSRTARKKYETLQLLKYPHHIQHHQTMKSMLTKEILTSINKYKQ